MTLKEFREKVAESKHSEYLKGLSVNIPYSHLAEPVKKTGITDIYRFFKKQHEEWSKINQKLPKQLKTSRDHFRDCLTKLENFIKSIQNKNENQLSRVWGQLHQKISVHQPNNNIRILTAEAPEVPYLLKVQKDYPSSFNAAYDYLIWKRVNNSDFNNNPGHSGNYLRGLNLAYEFELQDHTDIVQRRNNEKKSLGQLRSNFEEYISDAEESTEDYIERTHKNYEEHLSRLKTLETKKEELFDQWFANSQNGYQDFHSKMVSDADEMKELFRDGLRFAGPVKHWRRRALKMKKDGAFWIKWLTGSSALVALSLFLLLIFIPEGMTKSLFSGDPLAIKWAIIYVTFISFMVYAVRTFAKLTFSSYHLSRDAEEREQLTHVYLALKKDGNVEEKDRVLILQSIFSRTETGLLKDDSSPTLPGNNILNKINGSN